MLETIHVLTGNRERHAMTQIIPVLTGKMKKAVTQIIPVLTGK